MVLVDVGTSGAPGHPGDSNRLRSNVGVLDPVPPDLPTEPVRTPAQAAPMLWEVMETMVEVGLLPRPNDGAEVVELRAVEPDRKRRFPRVAPHMP